MSTPNCAVSARATAHTAVVFWQKPADAAAQEEYTLLLDGVPAGKTSRTHHTLAGLTPETAYRAEVVYGVAGAPQRALGVVEFSTVAVKRRLDVTAAPYFAKGDDATLNTAAMQRAIDDCGPGDAVYLPAGVYRTGALRLHSNMELFVAKDAVLQGTDEVKDYEPRIPSRFEGTEMECYSSLLNLGLLNHKEGANCRNVVIRGGGTIASGGHTLAMRVIELERARLKDYLAANAALVASCENDHTIPGRVRPRLINMSNCQNIWLHDLTLKNGASWNVQMIYSDNIVTDHCVFLSEGVWNGDGWDPDSSTNCTLFDSKFFTGDDAVAIKSGKNPEGNAISRPCAHIRVFDCHSAFGHGICIGSEMSGGVEDVQLWDCDLKNALSGIEIKATKKRGGFVRDISVRDCIAPRIMLHAVPYNDDGVPGPHPPVFARCRFERLTLTGRALDHDHSWSDVAPIEVAGFDVPGYEATDIRFADVTITAAAPVLPLQYCSGLSITNLTCRPKKPDAADSKD